MEPGGTFNMPTETIIVIAGIVAAFTLFAVVLAWADHRTRSVQPTDTAK